MSLFDRIWNRLPAELQHRLEENPRTQLTSEDMAALERAGIPVVQDYGFEAQDSLATLHLSEPFRQWIEQHASGASEH